MNLQHSLRRRSVLALIILSAMLLLSSFSAPAFAQYVVTNLVSNQIPIGANPADPRIGQCLGYHCAMRPARSG